MDNFFLNILIQIIASIISLLIVTLIKHLLRKYSDEKVTPELNKLRERPGNILAAPIYTLQNFLVLYLLFTIMLVLIVSLSPNVLHTIFNYLNINRTAFIHQNSIFVIVVSFLLLLHKAADSRRLCQKSISFRAISTELSKFDFENSLATEEGVKQLDILQKKTLTSISKCCHDYQSKIFRILARCIIYIRWRIDNIYTAVWIKLPNYNKKIFEVVDVNIIPQAVTKYFNLIDKIKLPFFDESAMQEWENIHQELLNQKSANKKNIKIDSEIYAHLEKKSKITSMTGEIYSQNGYFLRDKIKWEDWQEKPYLKFMDREDWKKCKIRSAAGVPIIYNNKKLGVLMITSNIPRGVGIFDLQILNQFSHLIARIIYHSCQKKILLPSKFHLLLDNAEDVI